MSMKTLERTLSAYLNLAKAELRPQQAEPQSQRPIQLLETSSMKLRRLVGELENTPQFSELIEATAAAFPRESEVHHFRGGQEVPAQRSDVENFFRRSRCYTSLYRGKEIDIDGSLRDLIAEYRKEQIRIRYLVPLRYIN